MLRITLSLLMLTFILVGIAEAQGLGQRPASTRADKRNYAIEEVDDMMADVTDSVHTVRFFNALTGDAIPDANVDIEGSGIFVTDWEGKARFPLITEDGNYRMTFSKNGFITTNIKLMIQAETVFFNRYSISPSMPLGNLRVVVDWEASPPDVDAHLVKQGVYHISYQNMRVWEDGVARLDRDDLDGYGPETITLRDVDNNGTYDYFLHNFTERSNASSTGLARSKAMVKVFGNDRLMNVFDVPQGRPGIFWHVFSIRDGQIIPVNQMVGSAPGN